MPIFIEHLELNNNSLLKRILDNSGDHSTMQLSSNENTGVTLPSDVHMDDISALSIGQGLQVPLDHGPYTGGGTAPPPEFLPDNPIEQGMNMTNISAEASEGAPTQHSMAENSGVDGGAGTKKPSKMRPGNTLTPR